MSPSQSVRRVQPVASSASRTPSLSQSSTRVQSVAGVRPEPSASSTSRTPSPSSSSSTPSHSKSESVSVGREVSSSVAEPQVVSSASE